MPDTKRYGIVGVQGRGSSHADYVADADDAVIVAGADIDEVALDDFSEEYKVSLQYCGEVVYCNSALD
jgi:predicted dehydrogenase